MKTHIFRLKPGQELRTEIQKYAKEHNISAGFIITCVAGFDGVSLRMAGATPDNQVIKKFEGHYEVVSLVGTVEANDCHLHASISDVDGNVFGGHLKSGTVFPTAEVVIGEDETKISSREPDANTGFNELVVRELA